MTILCHGKPGIHQPDEACYFCCDACNYDTHRCGGCGEAIDHGAGTCFDCRLDLCKRDIEGFLLEWLNFPMPSQIIYQLHATTKQEQALTVPLLTTAVEMLKCLQEERSKR